MSSLQNEVFMRHVNGILNRNKYHLAEGNMCGPRESSFTFQVLMKHTLYTVSTGPLYSWASMKCSKSPNKPIRALSQNRTLVIERYMEYSHIKYTLNI